VFLDVRAIESFSMRFPGADALCRTVGIDPYHALIPIAPAAHYHMGGVAVNAWGRSSVAGLWACGEVAATGVHGANRLASNSLLEGLVFAGRAAQDIAGLAPSSMPLTRVKCVASLEADAQNIEEIARLRRVMDEHVGVVRDHAGIAAGIDAIEQIASVALSPAVRNRVVLSAAIAQAACARLETRGSHARPDYPLSRAEYAHRSFVSSDALLRPFACGVAL
jgi:L-aspartate oxidase